MRNYFTLFFLIFISFLACHKSNPSKGIINHVRMIGLLTDIHTVDGRMYYIKQEPDSLYKYGTGRYLAVFKKYNTDSAQFKKSFKYYSTQPAELEAIYDDVTKSLKQKSDSLNKIQHKQLHALPK